MAEWPVIVKESFEEIARGMVEPGGEVAAMWANISGDPKAAVWIVCPRCGTLGHCPRKGSPADHGAGWEVTEGEAGLTMRPSILCNSKVRAGVGGRREDLDGPCGGHFWLTDGVLREA